MTAARKHDRPYLVSVDEIARGLEGRVLELAREQWHLDGQVDGNNFIAKNPLRHDRTAGSFMVGIAGEWKGLVRDFASGESWTLLQFTAQHAFSGNMVDAIKWAKTWLGLDGRDPKALRVTRSAIAAADERDDKVEAEKAVAAEKMRRLAYRRYLEGQGEIRGTPVDAYLRSRGIDIRRFDFPLGALRFHPALWNEESQQRWPAMVANIVGMDGEFMAVHRTWLQVHPDRTVTKAPLKKAKKVMAPYRGGLIRLWAGRIIDPDTGEIRKGRKLAKCKSGVILDISEGIEDGLSIALAMPELRVAAGVSISNMQGLKMPAQIARVTFWKQNDAPGSAADLGFSKAVANIRGQGKHVTIVRPPEGVKDINDFLKSLRHADAGVGEVGEV